jgi:hypothetical protein
MVKDLHFELSVKAPTPSIAKYCFFAPPFYDGMTSGISFDGSEMNTRPQPQ